MPAAFKTLAEAAEAFNAQEVALTTAQGQAQTNFANFTAEQTRANGLAVELETANTNLSAHAAEITQLKATVQQSAREFSEFRASEPQRFNAELTRHLAATGHAPVEAHVDTDGKAKAAAAKPDRSKLRGKELMAAAIEAQISKK